MTLEEIKYFIKHGKHTEEEWIGVHNELKQYRATLSEKEDQEFTKNNWMLLEIVGMMIS
ncbi:MAG: hypothetical protein MJZ26_12210 [Fibrobacter sp.]|nr:hypothetical protein [Fibrobacter sp.]